MFDITYKQSFPLEDGAHEEISVTARGIGRHCDEFDNIGRTLQDAVQAVWQGLENDRHGNMTSACDPEDNPGLGEIDYDPFATPVPSYAKLVTVPQGTQLLDGKHQLRQPLHLWGWIEDGLFYLESPTGSLCSRAETVTLAIEGILDDLTCISQNPQAYQTGRNSLPYLVEPVPCQS